MMLLQVPQQVPPKFVRDISQRLALDELHHPVDCARREDAVRHEFEIEVLLPEESIHECEELNNELILSEVVSILEYDGVGRSVVAGEVETEGEEVGFEDG